MQQRAGAWFAWTLVWLPTALAGCKQERSELPPAPAPAPPTPVLPIVRNPTGDCPAPDNGARPDYARSNARWLPDCKARLREQYYRVFASSEQRAHMLPRPDHHPQAAQLCREAAEGSPLRALLDRYTLCAQSPDVERVNAMTPADALAIAHALHERLRFTAQGGEVTPHPQTSDVLAICEQRPDLVRGVLAARCAHEVGRQRELAAGRAVDLVYRIPPEAEGPPLAAALNALYGIAER